jgi:hypothetical protein
MPGSSKCSLSFRFPHQILYTSLLSPIRATSTNFTKIKFHDDPLCCFRFDAGAETGKTGWEGAQSIKKSPLAVSSTRLFFFYRIQCTFMFQIEALFWKLKACMHKCT